VNASTNADKDKIFLMVINKNLKNAVKAVIDLKDFDPSTDGKAWVLTGPGVTATNETNPDTVKVVDKEFTINSSIFEFSFKPYSLTAIEINRRK
jgi:alpha-L-arabinofuranosidase